MKSIMDIKLENQFDLSHDRAVALLEDIASCQQCDYGMSNLEDMFEDHLNGEYDGDFISEMDEVIAAYQLVKTIEA